MDHAHPVGPERLDGGQSTAVLAERAHLPLVARAIVDSTRADVRPFYTGPEPMGS